MKKLTLAITMVMAVAGFTAFGQQTTQARKEVSEAKKDLKSAQKDLKLAEKDSIADFEKFKKEAIIKINDNEKKIAELKIKKTGDTKEKKEKYDNKVLALEQKNNELKKKIEGCSTDKPNMWTSFKNEVNNDMAEITKAFKDIAVNN